MRYNLYKSHNQNNPKHPNESVVFNMTHRSGYLAGGG